MSAPPRPASPAPRHLLLAGAGALALAALLVEGPPAPQRSVPRPRPEPVTPGMTPGQVRERLGAPDPTLGYDPDAPQQVWRYGFSRVIFRDGVVAGWRHAPGDAMVAFHIRDPDPEAPGITSSTTREELHRAMGTPDSLEFSVEDGPLYEYGDGLVLFDRDGELVSWTDLGDSLRIGVPPAEPGAPPVRPGAGVDALVAAMGPPVKWSRVGEHELWYYGAHDRSYVRLDAERRVVRWLDRDGVLAVSLGPRPTEAAPFGPGATPEEVYAAQGTPMGYRVAGLPEWRYGEARVEFEDGRVVRWSDPEGTLRAVVPAR